MRRFYRAVSVGEAEGGGFGVLLDGKPVRTPGRHLLSVPHTLAEALAEEWAAQDDEVRPDTMPLMKLASTALDLVAPRRAEVVDSYLKYADTDLLCYRAMEPSELIEREMQVWQPLLDWATLRFDAPLRVTAGIVSLTQPQDSLHALHAALAGLEPLALTAVAELTAAFGSLVLALAVWDGHLDIAAAFVAATLDETFQIEKWGEDELARRRNEGLREEVTAAARFLNLLR